MAMMAMGSSSWSGVAGCCSSAVAEPVSSASMYAVSAAGVGWSKRRPPGRRRPVAVASRSLSSTDIRESKPRSLKECRASGRLSLSCPRTAAMWAAVRPVTERVRSAGDMVASRRPSSPWGAGGSVGVLAGRAGAVVLSVGPGSSQ
ncbi:hypothetical protein ASD51_34130 [Streptomyces sp. Root55]|nr:hypothetical protein ASD51_34130 [Streptomyces sp. Root55]